MGLEEGKWDFRRENGIEGGRKRERGKWDGRKENGIGGEKVEWERGKQNSRICFPSPPALNPLLPLWNVPERPQFCCEALDHSSFSHSHKSQCSFPELGNGTFPHSQLQLRD